MQNYQMVAGRVGWKFIVIVGFPAWAKHVMSEGSSLCKRSTLWVWFFSRICYHDKMPFVWLDGLKLLQLHLMATHLFSHIKNKEQICYLLWAHYKLEYLLILHYTIFLVFLLDNLFYFWYTNKLFLMSKMHLV